MSAYSKTIFRTMKNQLGRFLAMMLIVLIGIAFSTGLGATPTNMEDSVRKYYTLNNVPDIVIKAPLGFSAEQLDFLEADVSVKKIETFFAMDDPTDDLAGGTIDTDSSRRVTRICFLPLADTDINKLELLDGRLPEVAGEIIVERASSRMTAAVVGEEINYHGQILSVVGVVGNPLLFTKEGIESFVKDKRLQRVIYHDSKITPAPMPMTTDAYIKLNLVHSDIFSDSYIKEVKQIISYMNSISTDANPLVLLSLSENESFAMFRENMDRIAAISYIFPVFFVLVAALVVLTTMTRLVEDERTVIGCYKTLGHGNGKICFKYLFYALFCGIVGSVLGMAAGFRLLPILVHSIYNTAMFHMPPLSSGFYYWFGLIASLIMILTLASITLYVTCSALKNKPAELLRHKTPKSGRKILLERIPFIWKHLKFKHKSTCRNVFRYVKHLIMTIVSVAGCTALIVAGFGLYDSINGTNVAGVANPGAAGSMIDTIAYISMVLIASAGFLTLVVIYNLTNMNIAERKREMATLKVLGYKDGEVGGYIFREVMLLTVLGILFGLPLGYGLLHFALTFMDAGVAILVKWYSWLASIGTVIAFTLIVDLLLLRKISSIDMSESLKIND